ncbi:uncharacterized protein LOC125492831 [Beta vulgaris subsp. vulgaris]|uniref:uncharacterized protein LOC125492831 n=1 Tax=Beta vulgaris subsp. vulgaris TaxID=3555 RepID=UPI0025483EC5|nr:uncharacterized protein LOC125492831 [Beta vulgaris subsp. vulgaris]
MCMKKPFMFLSLLVPGPKNPKGNLDVYIQPLIEELKQLWEIGAMTYDISQKQNFMLRAALLWTVSDFPAYGMLSGWATAGKRLVHILWKNLRKFLPHDHPFRKNKTAFRKNKVENGMAPAMMSGDDMWQCVKDLPKATDGPEALKILKKAKKGWFKQSSFWELPYRKDLLIRHNLDVMHIEKNFFDQLIHTVMDVKGQTSDNVSARKDLKCVCKRRQLELTYDERGNEIMPKAPFALDKAQRKFLCEWVRDLKFPNGYASELSRCVDLRTSRLFGMKSHDCHVLMERLLPVALKELLPSHLKFCANLQKIFPPAFFNSMEHFPIHLDYEAKVGGPVQYRWMYPFERFLNHLKRKVVQKARVEGSICNAYLFIENHHDPNIPEMFRVDCGRTSTNDRLRFLQDKEYDRAQLYVLANSGILSEYERIFEKHILETHPHISLEEIWSKCEAEYPKWFKNHVPQEVTNIDVVHALAMGPVRQVKSWNQFFVNGYNFQTHEYGKHKSTMNYGVCVKSHEEVNYYGILEEVIELVYHGPLEVYKTILFKYNWMDSLSGLNISDVPSTLCAPNEIPDYDSDGEEEQNEDVMLNDSRDSDNDDEDDSEDDLQVYENLEDFDDDDGDDAEEDLS